MHGSRVVGIEGQFDDERLRHRNTGAKMVMDGCSNGDRVDEVRVGHVRQVGHGVVLDCDLRDLGVLSLVFSKKFQIWQKVSDVVIFGVIYLRSSVHQCLWLWFLSNWLLLNNAVCTGPSYLLWVDVGSFLT